MRRAIALLVATLGLVACGSTPTLTTSHASPSPVAHATPSTTASASPLQLTDPATIPKLSGAYGLLYARGSLHLIKPDASIAASVSMYWNPVAIVCSGALDSPSALPPVSASAGHVYFREGNKIRMVVPPASVVDVTTVPDSSSVISFFSVSPDDKRIAVVKLDLSSTTTVTTSLYVEDLFGSGHHADIYSASASRSSNPTTLWPMGWHNANLVLAVVQACGSLTPTEWHVSSATTAGRVATIKGSNCQMSVWPSPAGVACAQASGPTTLYDWSGKVVGVTGPGVNFPISNTGLSPAGQSIYFSGGGATRLVQLGPGPYATLQGHEACGWIDEDHLLSTDALVQFPAETPGNLQVSVGVTPLPAAALPDVVTPTSSKCAGRFPGGL